MFCQFTDGSVDKNPYLGRHFSNEPPINVPNIESFDHPSQFVIENIIPRVDPVGYVGSYEQEMLASRKQSNETDGSQFATLMPHLGQK